MNSPPIRHRFVSIDEGRATLLHVDQHEPSRDWCVGIGFPQARDLQLVGGSRLLVGHHHGYAEFDLGTGERLASYEGLEGVTSVRRQPDGSTLVAGVNLAGVEGVSVLRLDEEHTIRHRARYPGDYVRLIRQTATGSYLMCCNDRIREGYPDGGYLREFPVEGFLHAWKALRFADERMLVSGGYGAFLVELDASGAERRRLGEKASLPAAVNPFFYAMCQRLHNGHTVVANWQGHGDGLGHSGVQLLEFSPDGGLVWTWSEAERISSLQGLLVLDGLDTTRLHDERNGLLEPVTP